MTVRDSNTGAIRGLRIAEKAGDHRVSASPTETPVFSWLGSKGYARVPSTARAHRMTVSRPLSRDMAVMKTVSIDRAAEILQVSRRTIYNHIRRGYLQTIRTIGGQSQRVTLESLALVQGAGRRRGERVFVAEQSDGTARIPQHPSSTSAPDVVSQLSERSFEFLGRPRLRFAQDVVDTTNRLRVLRGHLRDVSKVLRRDVPGDR
jgi:helix-turn-helix protein